MTINHSAMESSGILESQPTPDLIEHGHSDGLVDVKSSRLMSKLSISSHVFLRVCTIADMRLHVRLQVQTPRHGHLADRRHKGERSHLVITSQAIKPPPLTTDEAAYNAWMSGGSIGLGLWLANYKERTTKRRSFTVDEFATWATATRREEFFRTGANSEFCTSD